MSAITANHDVARCYEAGEIRRQLVCRLKCLISDLDDCDRANKPAYAIGGDRFPPDWAVPLITYPMYSRPEDERKAPVDDRPDWEKNRKDSAIMGGRYIRECACTKRNGLQADCELEECKGNPLCLIKPYPLCEPSGRANMKVTPQQANNIFAQLDTANSDCYGSECKEYQTCSPRCAECNASLRDICRWNPGWLGSPGYGCQNNGGNYWGCNPYC